jgi:glycosyltransferase involved in cell wall biosynthesis
MMEVSVIMPVYNAAAYVREAVESALAQPETAEVILVEDGSPDNSLAVCEALAAEHDAVRLYRHPEGANRGAGASRNLATQRSACPYIAFLDADDYYLPGRFAVARQLLEADPTIDGVYEAIEARFETAAAEQHWWTYGNPSTLTTLTQRVAPEDLFATLMSGRLGHFSGNGLVVRRAVLDKTGPFGDHRHEDTAMWIKMAAVARLVPGRLDEPVAIRRMYDNNRMVERLTLAERQRLQYILWRAVWEWGQRNLRAEQQRLVTRTFLSAALRPYGDDPPLRRRARSLLRLMALAIRRPGLVAQPDFWRVVVHQGRAPWALWERARQIIR